MASISGSLYDALVSANVPSAMAQEAAQEVASFERELAEVRSSLRVLRWMTGSAFFGAVLLIAFLA